MTGDALAARLRQTFLDELEEQLVVLNGELLALESDGTGDGERLARIFRVAHTLKGAARVADVPLAEQVCHAVESVLADVRAARRGMDADVFALLFATVDALEEAGQRLRSGRSLDDSPLASLARAPLEVGPPARARSRAPSPVVPPPSVSPPEQRSFGTGAARGRRGDVHVRASDVVPLDSAAAEVGGAVAPSSPSRPDAASALRVDAARLEQLLAAAGQLSVTVARAAGRPTELEAVARDVEQWLSRWRRVAPRLRQALEAGEATEADRQLAHDLDGWLRQLASALRTRVLDSRGDERALGRISAELTDQVRTLRMRPFGEAAEALPRLVRDLAAETGKEVELQLAGTEVEADRTVLDGVREALLHLVRNAVDHGLETSAERTRRGKPPRGTLRVGAALRGGSLRVTVSDDGRGLDVRAIREQVARQGHEPPGDERALVRLLFEGGLSTRAQATEISGRGVGLDAVRAAIERVRGSVDVRWTAGEGTTFLLHTPITLATQRVVLVKVGGQRAALPSSAVARLLRVDPSQLRSVDDRRLLPTADGPVPIASLARLLGPPLAERPAAPPMPVALLEVGERRAAVTVDELIDEVELVVRPIERRGAGRLPHLVGASLLPDGCVALVLNPATLVAAALAGRAADAPTAESRVEESGPPRILVVDDSITTRTLERSVLEAAGYEVVTAVDGEDGWRLLQEQPADLVLSDVEMPRLDGFALCERIRGSRQWAQLPVVLVTSLEAPEQRARGMEAGADAYVVKSGFDQEALLATVRDLLAREET